MNIINRLYKKLKAFFNKKQNRHRQRPLNDNELDDRPIGSITFSLYDNNDIDIFCFLPDSDSMTVDDVTKKSEDYGKFLSSITDGLVVDTMIKLLNQTKKESNSPTEQLFIENVLFFWALSHVNHHSRSENKKKNKNRPVIRPTMVFAQTKTSFD